MRVWVMVYLAILSRDRGSFARLHHRLPSSEVKLSLCGRHVFAILTRIHGHVSLLRLFRVAEFSLRRSQAVHSLAETPPLAKISRSCYIQPDMSHDTRSLRRPSDDDGVGAVRSCTDIRPPALSKLIVICPRVV
jgi:hypothetical protein